MGDIITIKVVAANLAKRQLDYEWVLKPEGDSETGSKKHEIRGKKHEVRSKKYEVNDKKKKIRGK
jgi:ribonuclease R